MKYRLLKKNYKRFYGHSWKIFYAMDWAFYDNKRLPSRMKYRKESTK